MKQLSLYDAKRLSLIKWKYIVKEGYWKFRERSSKPLENLRHRCGFCERYKYGCEVNCKDCELGKIIGYCPLPQSLYRDVTKFDRLVDAQTILRAIESIEIPKDQMPSIWYRLKKFFWK